MTELISATVDAVADESLDCFHMIPHRNARNHHCDCVCVLRKGHEGRHFCAWESA